MKRWILFFSFVICQCLGGVAQAQSVTRISHKKAVMNDEVTTGEMTVRKPDYICISTNGGKDVLQMEDTQFTMIVNGKKHVTNSQKNRMFATFQKVLLAVINSRPLPQGEDLTVSTQDGLHTVSITPKSKKRQMFTSLELVIDAKTSQMKKLRMNGRGGSYVEYRVK